MKLFHLENPLTLRFGNDFFRALPTSPGVYFFHGGDDRLLYIGQSANLRARVGSYRHVTQGKNPKRTLRLVSQVARIEWQACATPAEAIELERVLLLERRPPFNRAGVWQGAPWYLELQAQDGAIHLELSREAAEGRLGPFTPAFRHALGSIVRCLMRVTFPSLRMAEYPHRMIGWLMPLKLRLTMPQADAVMEMLSACIQGRYDTLLAALNALPAPPSVLEQEYWQTEIDELTKQAARCARQSLLLPSIEGFAAAPASAFQMMSRLL
ncbi:MAG: GIY-YIG nuclease family protein [Prosthecobacter sp.]